MDLPTVAIVGRPNVGKSSLFNRFLHRRKALVDKIPGVTRDRIEAQLTWRGTSFRIVDTGGLDFEHKSTLAATIQRQVKQAVKESDLLLFVCDAVTGLLPLDAYVAENLRKSGKPILLVVNKADTETLAQRAVEFHEFGFGTAMPVSSMHGRGTGDLLDMVIDRLPRKGLPAQDLTALRLVIVGRPNVGKSSFVNRLAGQERVTVDNMPGTTRDAIEVPLVRGARRVCIVDTAGVRARPKLKTFIDIVSVHRSLEEAEQADGVLMLLDVSAGILGDDLTLLGKILKLGRPCVVAMNKWDLVDAGDPDQYKSAFYRRAPFASFVPAVATSAVTGYHVWEAYSLAKSIAERAARPMPEAQLRGAFKRLCEESLRSPRMRHVKLLRLRQWDQRRTGPVKLELSYRGRVKLRSTDLSFAERILRESLELKGIPIQISLQVDR